MYQRGYAICTVPRSGSNLLCQFLTSTGYLGKPLEYFNTSARRILNDPAYPSSLPDQVRQILTTGATPNGVYGTKLFQYQHLAVSQSLDWTLELPCLSYVYLKRRDVLGQALSWARAIQTSQYRSTQPAFGEPRYDAELFRKLGQNIDQEYNQWDAFFRDRNIQPLQFDYEDLVTDPQRIVDLVAQKVGVTPNPQIAYEQTDLRVQRDRITDDWRERFGREGAAVT
jgi:LPS sulfotransferase NodH